MILAMLLTMVTLHPNSYCTFTTDIPALEPTAIKACNSDLVKAVVVTGTLEDVNLVIDYAIDMLNQNVAGTGKDIEALRQSIRTWNYWREHYGSKKFSIKYRDTAGRNLCWFSFDADKSLDMPTENRCVQAVE